MLRCHCPSVCPSLRLSVTEVHWRIIANLGFKFRSKFTAHCGRGEGGVILTTTSRAMLATARPSCSSYRKSTQTFKALSLSRKLTCDPPAVNFGGQSWTVERFCEIID